MDTVTTSAIRSKPRPKPALSVRLDPPPFGVLGALTISVGKQSCAYLLTRLKTDFGEGWQFDKIDGEEHYQVNIGEDGHHLCDCLGQLHHGTRAGRSCKHIDALLTLRAAGKLGPAEAFPIPEPIEQTPMQASRLRFRSAGDMAANDPVQFEDDAAEYAAWSATVRCVACGAVRHECDCQEPS